MVRLENVCKTFRLAQTTIEAVKNVNIHVEKGSIFGIIGFSGAGKSTLVRCINFLEVPTSGKVFIDGTELGSLSEVEVRQIRKRIGMIFQQFNLFASRTVFGNVAFPLAGSGLSKAQTKERVSELLKLVGLEGRENDWPSQLSGGQKQRVAIARALASHPDILLCDEATSALDPQNTHAILQLLRSLNKQLGLTIVMITHEMGVIKEICDHVAVMENGVVVEQGEVYPIFANPKHKMTANFLEMTSHMAGYWRLVEENSPVLDITPGQCILNLRFITGNVSEALISQLSRKFSIDLSIIAGNIEMIHGSPLGGLVLKVTGEPKQIDECLAYLQTINVGVEVLKDARVAQ